MDEIVKHINDTNASFRAPNAGNAKNTDLFLDNAHYDFFKDAGEQVTVRFNKENLSKAILFIASILPRKYDNSAKHKLVSYSPEFVYDQLAVIDSFFKEDGVSVTFKKQVWNARKDVLQRNGKIDSRFYFNGLLEDVKFYDSEGKETFTKFTIRNYLAGGYSDLHIKKAEDGVFDVWVSNVLQPYFDDKDDGLEQFDKITSSPDFPLQTIYYGAPGTGKSYKVKSEKLQGVAEENIFRTTFHPDYDYASFVGCYKPKKEGEKITYSFVPQVFTNAYVKAWNEMKNEEQKPVYLVIEEINRGNCAQIFGDLFQLLDRGDNGKSEYPVDADEDLMDYLIQKLGEDSEGIKDGKLCLPPNLNILATMNTSDQSLFPMDSAFKRRWEWEYVPIRYTEAEAKDVNDNFHTFKITIGSNTYKWVKFLAKVNEKILAATYSEDKQMGEYFIKKDIDEKTFINKVMYYLWSEVGKDLYNTPNAFFTLPQDFKDKDGKSNPEFSFNELFKDKATELLVGFMKKLQVKSEEEKEKDNSTENAESLQINE